MRFIFAALLWVLTTVALAGTVTAAWTQNRVINEDGYAKLVAPAADDPVVQRAVADELTAQIVALGKKQGTRVDQSRVADMTTEYTHTAKFRDDFVTVAREAHRWLFTYSTIAQRDSQGRWQIDLAPMARTLVPPGMGLKVPDTLQASITDEALGPLAPGRLASLTRFGPIAVWVGVGLTLLLAGMMQLAVRRTTKGIVALGISTLLVGATGWAALEVGLSHAKRPLARLTEEAREVADAVLHQAVGNAHQWLSVTMIAGVLVIIAGIAAGALGSLLRR